MEYFRIIPKRATEKSIQQRITPQTVAEFTETMSFLKSVGPNFTGMTLWGDFTISYHHINGGVRFCLLECPNALTWTITTGYPPAADQIVIHSTINRVEKEEEFIEEHKEFLDEWEEGLLNSF